MLGILLVFIATIASFVPQKFQSESPTGPVLTIERTGGFAGVDDHVSIYADGKVIDGVGKVLHIPPATIERFIRSVETVGTPAPGKGTAPQNLCSDCFIYRINISQNNALKSFTLGEPIVSSSEKESDDAKAIREFLKVVFIPSQHK